MKTSGQNWLSSRYNASICDQKWQQVVKTGNKWSKIKTNARWDRDIKSQSSYHIPSCTTFTNKPRQNKNTNKQTKNRFFLDICFYWTMTSRFYTFTFYTFPTIQRLILPSRKYFCPIYVLELILYSHYTIFTSFSYTSIRYVGTANEFQCGELQRAANQWLYLRPWNWKISKKKSQNQNPWITPKLSTITNYYSNYCWCIASYRTHSIDLHACYTVLHCTVVSCTPVPIDSITLHALIVAWIHASIVVL
jgi:hypothetical protein